MLWSKKSPWRKKKRRRRRRRGLKGGVELSTELCCQSPAWRGSTHYSLLRNNCCTSLVPRLFLFLFLLKVCVLCSEHFFVAWLLQPPKQWRKKEETTNNSSSVTPERNGSVCFFSLDVRWQMIGWTSRATLTVDPLNMCTCFIRS